METRSFLLSVNLLWPWFPCRQLTLSLCRLDWNLCGWALLRFLQQGDTRAAAAQGSAHARDLPGGGRSQVGSRLARLSYPRALQVSEQTQVRMKFLGYFIPPWPAPSWHQSWHDPGTPFNRLAGAPPCKGALPAQPPLPTLWLHVQCHIPHPPQLLPFLDFRWLLFLKKDLILATSLHWKYQLMWYYSETLLKPPNCRPDAVIHAPSKHVAVVLSVTRCALSRNLKHDSWRVLYKFVQTLSQFSPEHESHSW